MADYDINDRIEEQRQQANAWIEEEKRLEEEEETVSTLKRRIRKTRKRRQISLMKRMMLSSLGPLLFMGIVVTTYAIMMLKGSLKDQKQNSLLDYGMTVRNAIIQTADGDFKQEGGKTYLGSQQIGSKSTILDDYSGDGGVELTLYYGDDAVVTTIADKDSNRVSLDAINSKCKAMVYGKGKFYSTDSDILAGKKYYSVYLPIKANNKVVGAICASQPTSSVDKLVNKQIASLATIAIVILIIAVVIVAYSSYSTAKSTKRMSEELSALADGYLSITVNMSTLRRDDEIGVMARALQRTAKRMTDVVHEINSITRRLVIAGTKLEESCADTGDTARGISNAVEEISRGAATQADDVVKANESVSVMGDGITSIVDSLQSLSNSTQVMLESDKESEMIITELVASTNKTTGAIKEVSEKVNDTDRAVEKIREAVSIITNIADETNLLSLNASIEAARAGEAGRGFSVVAIQIQKLAEESARSAERIEETIAELSVNSHAAVSVMNEIDSIVKEQLDKLELTKKHFQSVSKGIITTINETELIQEQSRTCDMAREDVINTISSLSFVSEANATSSEATTNSMEDLNKTIELFADSARNLQHMAVKLEENVQFFKL